MAVVIISKEKRAEGTRETERKRERERERERFTVGVDDFCFVIGWSWPAMTN